MSNSTYNQLTANLDLLKLEQMKLHLDEIRDFVTSNGLSFTEGLLKLSNYEVDFNARNSKVENILINFDVVGDAEFTEIKKPICILNDKTRKMYHHFNNILNSYYQKDRPFLINSYYLQVKSLPQISFPSF